MLLRSFVRNPSLTTAGMFQVVLVAIKSCTGWTRLRGFPQIATSGINSPFTPSRRLALVGRTSASIPNSTSHLRVKVYTTLSLPPAFHNQRAHQLHPTPSHPVSTPPASPHRPLNHGPRAKDRLAHALREAEAQRGQQKLLRLRRQKPHVVQRALRHLPVPRLLRQPPQSRRAH